jgi:hypothetical protein
MGGQTFEGVDCVVMTKEEHDAKIQAYNLGGCIQPFRLKNKDRYHDIDLIETDLEKIKFMVNADRIAQEKTIPLFEERFHTETHHLLTTDNIQIDVLKPFDTSSYECTQAFFSYSIVNVWMKKLVALARPKDYKLSYLGILCYNNSLTIPSEVSIHRLDQNTRLIKDVKHIFETMNLDYSRFIMGFDDELELYEYLKTSKYFDQVVFKMNSKFRHDLKRLPPLQRLYDMGLVNIR